VDGDPVSDRRDAILRSSAQEIARHGIRGLRVTDVANNAGVSTALLYYHFTDRAGLLDAALQFMTEQAQSYRTHLDAASDSAWQRLLNHVTQEFQDDPVVVETTMAWNELRASSVYEPELRTSLVAATAIWRNEIAESIQAAIDAGEIPDRIDAQASARVIVALMEGIGGQWMGGEFTVPEVHELLTATVTTLLRPGRE
jgi:AcrR family transcriptional regulator